MKNIAVIFGGKSPEHDVSIITALTSIIKPLEILGYNVMPIYITKTGRWVADKKLKDVKTYQNGLIEKLIKKHSPEISFGKVFRIGKINIDLVFPAMHGAYGEDGSLMGLLRLANVPFVGCDMESSVVAMNKILAKQIANENKIPTSKFVNFTREEFETDRKRVVETVKKELKFPVFVKPPHLGSSIGITKVNKLSDLENALEVAAYYDNQILIEEGINNLIEVTLPIIGNNELTLGLVERPLNHGEDFFDFDTKYMQGGKKGKGGKGGKSGTHGYSELPAKLPKKLYTECERVATDIYRTVGLSGISRIDMLIDEKSGKVYFNEINTLPGGLYAHNFAKNGLSNVELVEELLKFAQEKFNENQKITTTFDTNYLKQF